MVAAGIVMGIAGTLAMDVWAYVLTAVFRQPFPNWAMPGRWLAHVFGGRVFHDDIKTAAPVAGERTIGWVFHYAVGVVYGIAFVVLAGRDWLADPAFLPIWLFSLATIAAGWFLLQPGMGLGWAASRTPNPWKVRIMGLMAHTVFAVGMWLAAMAIHSPS